VIRKFFLLQNTRDSDLRLPTGKGTRIGFKCTLKAAIQNWDTARKEASSGRMVGKPSLSGLWKGCP
jgi:hypothetical protein